MKYKPTKEQERVIEAFLTGRNLKINAYAGTGKTSTLTMLAHATPRKGQYIAFNRSIVNDAKSKFPWTVECQTSHQLAYHALIQQYEATKLTQNLTVRMLKAIKGYNDTFGIYHDGSSEAIGVLTPYEMTYLYLKTVDRFCNSEEAEIKWRHIPYMGIMSAMSGDDKKILNKQIIERANEIWEEMQDRGSDIPLGFNGMLKLWTLSKPQLACDYIMLDEAQDTNGAVLSILNNQEAQIVYTGDKYQQIYGWRGAVNAMDRIQTDLTRVLTKSFRFAEDIADFATNILQLLDCDDRVTGNEEISGPSQSRQTTILTRSNAKAIEAVLNALMEDKKPYIVGDGADLKKIMESVIDLKRGRKSSLTEFFGFKNWEEVVLFANTPAGEDLSLIVNLESKFGAQNILDALSKITKADNANVIISTGHKAKGLEWDRVQLENDFINNFIVRREAGLQYKVVPREELRLFYVAATRARKELNMNEETITRLHEFSAPNSQYVVEPADDIEPANTRREQRIVVTTAELTNDTKRVGEHILNGGDPYEPSPDATVPPLDKQSFPKSKPKKKSKKKGNFQEACAVLGLEAGLSKMEYKKVYLEKKRANNPEKFKDADAIIRSAAQKAMKRLENAWAVIDATL